MPEKEKSTKDAKQTSKKTTKSKTSPKATSKTTKKTAASKKADNSTKAASKAKTASKSKAKAASEGAPQHDVLLITGFPGFLAGQLVRRLAKKHPDAHFVFLVVPDLQGTAESRLLDIERDIASLKGRWEVLAGDITLSDLGFAERFDELTEKVTHVWHLAAIYDLAVPEGMAMKVNLFGTINVLDFCEACTQLKRYAHVSTCFVSGERQGIILEDELDLGQTFKNHYESTKFYTEYEVQRRMKRIPTVIFRPGIVVGDSRTGETDKYDGPYYLIKLLLHLPNWFPWVNIGRGQARVNLVPVDFVVDAMAHITARNDAVGQVFQLADPNPMRARDIMSTILEEMGRRPPLAMVPSDLVTNLMKVDMVRRIMQMPRETVIYFNHEALYDSTNTIQALEGSGIQCPHLTTYLGSLIDYVRANPEKGFLDGRAF